MASQERLRRFLHLERARPAGPDPEPLRERPDAIDERISGVERPHAPAGEAPRSRTGARLDRFGPDPEPTLELVDTEGRRPFIRCRRCAMDNNVFATACMSCGVSLDTAEQHDFDERFWTERQAEAEREALQEAERRELRARAEAEDARARRTMAEGMAREVGERERKKLDALGGGGWGDAAPRPWAPLGLRIFRRFLHTDRSQIAALALSAGLAATLAAYGIHAHSTFAGVVGGATLALLLAHAPE